MKSDRPDKNGQPELNKHTRVRLIQQNKRLMAEIAKLDHLITNILNKSVSNEFEQVEGDHQLKARY